MQLQTEIKTSSGELEAARVTLGKLLEAAADANAEAERWRIAFEREPTAQSHTSSAIAAQRARNAEADVTKHRQAVLEPLERAERAAARRSLETAITRATEDAEVSFCAAAQAFAEAAQKLKAASALLNKVADARSQAMKGEATVPPLSADHFVAKVNAVLEPLKGGPQDFDTTWAALRYTNSNDSWTLEFRVPAGMPGAFR